MDPRKRDDGARWPWLPRTRGDGPGPERDHDGPASASPHTRGWTHSASDAVYCAIAASPHTRGWTAGVAAFLFGDAGFPAHAGMDPRTSRRWTKPRRLPRTRGDGPPAVTRTPCPWRASPHTRGWTLVVHATGGASVGFPAHAGMDPPERRRPAWWARLPRTRGDGPDDVVPDRYPE